MTESSGAIAPIRKVTEFNGHLRASGACQGARDWAKGKSATEAWTECERPDWLLWWAAKDGETRVNLVRCACLCARTALKYVPAGEERPRLAIEAAERWCEDPTSDAAAAYAAAYVAYAAAAAYVANAAAHAAYAAAYAAAAAYVANAANAAAYAANAATYAAYAYAAARREMCEIIRGKISQPWSEK